MCVCVCVCLTFENVCQKDNTERVGARDLDRGIGSRHRKNRVRSDQRPIGSAGPPHTDKRADSPWERNQGGLEVLGGDVSVTSPVSDDLYQNSREGESSLEGSLVEELLFDDA